MSLQQQILLIWGACLLIGILAIPIVLARAKRKAAGQTESFNIMKVEKKFLRYSNNFLTRKRFNAIVKSYSALSCLTLSQVKSKSVKIFEKAVIVSAAIPIILTLLLRNPIIGLLGVLVALVYYTVTVDKTIDSMYSTIINEVADLIQSISLNYLEFANIPRAILEGDRGEYLGLIVDDMYSIITDVNTEEKLNEFLAKSPLKLLCELMEVCQITAEHGDSYNERGQSKFIEQLGVLEKEVNLEIRTIAVQKSKFNVLDKMALFGVVLMPIVDWYMLSQIPGTAIVINGVLGLGVKVFVLILTVVAYYVISTINKKSVVSSTDFSEMSYAMTQDKRFIPLINSIKPKSYKNVTKVQSLLEESLSSHTIETFFATKLIYTIFMGFLGLSLSIIFVISAKAAIYNNTGTLSFLPILVEARMQEDIDRMDAKFFKLEKKPEGEELQKFVESNVRDLNDLTILEQSNRLQKKWDTYQGIKFQPYYFLLIYGLAVIGWFVPNLQIKLRKFLVRYEAEEDASQLQTVMITLSGTGLSVYEVLHRLLDLSTVHKASISYACQTFIRDPELALEILAMDSRVPEFKRMCTKLSKAIYNLPIQDAFGNIVVEKEQSLSLKELEIKSQINRKANLANILAIAPVGAVLVLQALLPLIILGFGQILGIQDTLGGM